MTILSLSVLFLFLSIDFAKSLYSKSLDWNKYDDREYSDNFARSDFGSITGWKNDRAKISNKSLRITLKKQSLSDKCGIVSNTMITSGTEYQLEFSVKFHSEFDWSRGGKVGFGLGMGEHNTGCRVPTKGEGATLRLMWYQNDQKRVYFIPYLYYYKMPGNCGDNFGKSYPKTGSLERGKWYQIQMYMKSNAGENKNGHVTIKVNNEILIDQKICWTKQENKRFIDNLSFHTFRGGSNVTIWGSNTDGYIYYDNLSVKQIK
ncbi:unnamed protein product [Adineta ricciae]|uniref:Polysaccharide lyase 14 domain-containing protein n=1 Tax=Adineta ricciae TaxID=249248 RepID=A0A815TJ66_ADIRI|nr:unnamed protein product [Adineta ricciae]CAF1572422.1 unnamed protein product [Adineta ricciae]